MAKKFLNPADVHSRVEQMRGEGMTQGVSSDFLLNRSSLNGSTDRPADALLEDMVPARDASAWVFSEAR